MSYQIIIASEVFYSFAIATFKVSTLYLFMRVFPGRKFQRTLIAVGIFIMIYSITQMLLVVFECTPVNRVWNLDIPGTCIDINTIFIACSALNIATDFVILALPIQQLWQLKISNGQKLQLTAIFALGSLWVTISSTVVAFKPPDWVSTGFV